MPTRPSASRCAGTMSSRGSRAASTRPSTRSSAPSTPSAGWWPTRATSCARPSRACARTSRRSRTQNACPRPSAPPSATTSSRSSTSSRRWWRTSWSSRAAPSRATPIDDIRLDEIAASVIDRARARAGERLEFSAELEPTLVRGEPARIQRAISNLVDNAVKWSPPGGEVELRLAGRRADRARPRPRLRRAPTCRTSSSASTARATRAACRAPASGSRSSARPPRRTAAPLSASNAPGGGALMRVSFGPLARRGRGGRAADRARTDAALPG